MDSASIVANSPSLTSRPDLTSAKEISDGGKVAQADAQAAKILDFELASKKAQAHGSS